MSLLNLFTKEQKFWLFYAGPESYLDKNGELDFSQDVLWSCEPETRKGDLVLLYRRSMKQTSLRFLTQQIGMTEKFAKNIKDKEIGKDISAVWQIESNAKKQAEWAWEYGCVCHQILRLTPPIKFDELKGVGLHEWESFRRGFASEGKNALAIPPSAWKIFMDIIERKYGQKVTV